MNRIFRSAALAVISSLGLTGFLCARTTADTTAMARSGHLLYVADQAQAAVSVIDMSTNAVVATVDLQALGFAPNAKPHHVVVEPDGSAWYLSLIAANRVLKFDRDNDLVGQVEFERPGMMALDPTSNRLYVGRSMAAVNPPQRIGIIDRQAMTIDEVDVFFPRPHAIAVHPAGRYVFSGSLAVNQIAGYDAETGDVELTAVEGPTHTFVQFAITPDGKTLVASAQLTGDLLIFDVSQGPKPGFEGSVKLGRQPWHPVITPDGRYVYVGNQEDNTVSVVDLRARKVVATVAGNGLAEPHGSAVSADGKYVYISNRNLKGEYSPAHTAADEKPVGTVVVIATASNTIERVIEVGHYPAGIGTNTPMPR